MRSVDDIRDYAERFDIENDNPFCMPDENNLQYHNADFMKDAGNVLDFASWSRSDGASCDSDRTSDETKILEKEFADIIPPANNMGPVTWGL